MKTLSSLIVAIIAMLVLSGTMVKADEIKARKITEDIYVMDTNSEDQAVIISDSGLVVINSFWSEVTAREYKNAMVSELGRSDFYRLIDMVDRLDMFGGNAAYKEIPIIGHREFWDKYKGKEAEVDAEIDRLINMWRRKEVVSRERLKTYEPGSNDAIVEENWSATCKQRADELEQGFSLVLPTEVYDDRGTLNLGNITLNLIWFGRAGYNGMSLIVIPEAKLAIIPGFILHSQHLAPYPQPNFARLDVERWIRIFEEILEGDSAVDNVLCDTDNLWTRERALTHLNYIRRLWNDVAREEAKGTALDDIQEMLSLENDFAFVKEMQVYKDHGDDWIRPQHRTHIRQFFLQHKNLASEILLNAEGNSIAQTLASIRKALEDGNNIYIDEISINAFAYKLMGEERFTDAAEILKLNVEIFPQSANAYDSYAEALMNCGDMKNAKINYERSLELNPDNSNAKAMLERLGGTGD